MYKCNKLFQRKWKSFVLTENKIFPFTKGCKVITTDSIENVRGEGVWGVYGCYMKVSSFSVFITA